MPRANFSTETNSVYELALDLIRGDFSSHIDEEKVTKKDLENHLRDKINEDMLKGRTLYQAMRRNDTLMYEVTEEIVNVCIEENVLDSAFINTFVEWKNRRLGDTTEFYSEGGLISVATFAGNHWDTDREALDIGDVIKLPREWCYIHVYEELERFLLGITTLDKLMDKIYKSVNKFIQDRIYAQFTVVAQAVPAEFSVKGNSEAAVGGLCDLVAAAGGYPSLEIAGTKGALRKLAQIVPDKMFANSQKEAKAQTGSIGEWEGNALLVIPQTLKSGTFELALNDNQLFVFGADTKPIKFEFIGDTRSDYDTEGKKHNDQTIDIQVQTKFGIGLVLPPYFGMFTFAD